MRNSPPCCGRPPRSPSRYMVWFITSTQVAPPPCSPAHGGWTRKNPASPRKSSSPSKKQVLFAAPTRPGRPRCTWCPRRTAPGAPAATTAAS
ncbi:MAG: hypothetical protein ACK55Z_05600, partial [bacterium]